ncbi:MAG TPA: flagellar export protein FliJ [Chthonomonadaceae bacterium]|nr:flagellar export protein FliJ [Chthonomonadaceae bacterium]
MRRFKFRLETVLRHRETIETLREQEFAAAQGYLQALEARIAALQEEFRQTVAGRPGGAQGERFDTQEIADRERYVETLLAAIGQMQRRAEAARVQAEEKRQALVAARQAREAVSHLKEKDLGAHIALGNKLEQEALDELATLRHVRGMKTQSPQNSTTDVTAKEAA